MRRFLTGLVVVIVVFVVGYALFAWTWGVPRVEDHATATDPETIARGQYLAEAGDCISCHTAPDGAAYAGGYAVDSPFGTIYGSNITPADSGIKDMTSAQFYQILAYGADSIWHPVYPAMPYTEFHNVTREDSDAIFAYLMSLPPAENVVPENTLSFPYNLRLAMFGWNLLFADRQPFQPDSSKDEVWNRGAYLVQGLAHCGTCHTPRNFLGGPKEHLALAGATLGNMVAPDIRPEALAAAGWNEEFLATYFETGASPRGSAWGEMFLTVKDSLSKLTHDDRIAIATYLMDGQASDPSYGETQVAGLDAAAGNNAEGRVVYLNNCALCHGAGGEGVSNTMPPLAGNATLAEADGVNMIRAIVDGIEAQAISPGSAAPAFGPMPSFADRLDATQMTELANYLRTLAPGPALIPLTEDEVAQIME